MHRLCFREQGEQEFFEQTIPQALERSTRVTLDPPALAGDCLAIDARRAAFRDLTLAAERLDLLAALLRAMRVQHEKAIAALGQGSAFQRVFLTIVHPDVVPKLIPPYAAAKLELAENACLQGIARLFHMQ